MGALLAIAVLAAGMSVPPAFGWTLTPAAVPMIHLLMEMFAIVIAMIVVVFSWHTFDLKGARASRILICGFLVVAVCDTLHALTYDGMPPLLVPASTPRAIYFWLMGRTAETITLALLALKWVPLLSRRVWLALAVVLSAALVWFGSYRLQDFPATFVAGQGVTAFKAGYEYALCVANLLVAALFWRRSRRAVGPRYDLLALSSFVMGIGELMFTSYVAPSDFQNMFGHAFKIAAYVLLYRATFATSVRAPFEAARESERQLAESEQKLRALYELSPIGISLTDAQGRFVEFNEAFRVMTGYTAAELKALDYWELTPQKYREEQARQIESLAKRGRYGPFEKEYIRKDGSLIPLQLVGMPITGNDGKQYIWSIVEDITERRRASSALETKTTVLTATLENMSQGISVFDADLNLLACNRRFIELLEFPPELVAEGRTLEDQFRFNALRGDYGPGDPEEQVRYRVELCRRFEPHVFERVRPDGTVLEVRGIPMPGGGFVTTHTDITERKRHEADLVRLNAELEARVRERTHDLELANEDISSFSYSVAHDLRAPLRAITGFSAIVMEESKGKLEGPIAEQLQRIRVNGQRMGLLIDDLLKLTQVSRQPLQRADCDLSDLAARVVRSLAESDPARKVSVTVQPGMAVNADPGLLVVLLENLIGNAWKFTSKTDGAKIEIGSLQLGGKRTYFVRDNGAGFNMEHAKKLFAPFERLHTGGDFEGTGIGLSIVNRVVRKHGGRPWAESSPGEGAAFYFTLG